jgi:hypothetical protein
VLARVAAVFADTPILNPDGSCGINVIQDFGQGGHLSGGNRIQAHSAILPDTFDATYAAIEQETSPANAAVTSAMCCWRTATTAARRARGLPRSSAIVRS